MRSNANKKSFVLIFTMTILSLITVMTHQLLRVVNVGTNFDRTMVDREAAEMLALGGINVAIAQLTQEGDVKKAKDKKQTSSNKEAEETDKEKRKKLETWLEGIISNLNVWQTFNLDEEIDGIEGQLQICITCENGKININEAFDFKKQEFKPAFKTFLSKLKFQGVENKATTGGTFLKKLTEFLKKRNKKIDDISELRTDQFKDTKLFYEPPEITEKERDARPNTTLAIQDIFTTWTSNDKLDAMMLSDSLRAMLGMRRPTAFDKKFQKSVFKKLIKNFKPETDQNTEEFWKFVRPLYKPKSSFKVQNTKIFSSKFEPTTYSVLSSGKVGNVEQRLLAIIKKVKKENIATEEDDKESGKGSEEKSTKKAKKQDTKTSDKKDSKPKHKQAFRVVRLYWI